MENLRCQNVLPASFSGQIEKKENIKKEIGKIGNNKLLLIMFKIGFCDWFEEDGFYVNWQNIINQLKWNLTGIAKDTDNIEWHLPV